MARKPLKPSRLVRSLKRKLQKAQKAKDKARWRQPSHK